LPALLGACRRTEAEIHFEKEGSLTGTRLVGFCLWKRPDCEIYVTFPSRAFGAASERRYFTFPLFLKRPRMATLAGFELAISTLKGCLKRRWRFSIASYPGAIESQIL